MTKITSQKNTPLLIPIPSWADEAEAEKKGRKLLPPASEIMKNGLKIVTDFKYTPDGKMEKRVRTYRIEHRLVPKPVAVRKRLKKFGDSVHDDRRPNPSNTFYDVEEVQMQFLSANDMSSESNESDFDKLKEQKSFIKCRLCGANHWTLSCPYKEVGRTKDDESALLGFANDVGRVKTFNKYVPSNQKEDISGRRSDGTISRSFDDVAIRISNLSEHTTDYDLQELVRPFGPISKFFLTKDMSGSCRGTAFIHFKSKSDALAAIRVLNKYKYGHLILDAELLTSGGK